MESTDTPTQKAWFREWLAQHVGLHARGDWPPADRDGWTFYKQFYVMFVELRIDQPTANLASERLAYQAQTGRPVAHLSDHPGRIRAELVAIAREKIAEAGKGRVDPGTVMAEQRLQERWMGLTAEERERWRALVRSRYPEMFLQGMSGAFADVMGRCWFGFPDSIPPPRDPEQQLRRSLGLPARPKPPDFGSERPLPGPNKTIVDGQIVTVGQTKPPE